jgi:DNA polymerase-1
MILQVHDELVFDCYKPEQEQVQAIVLEAMTNALPLSIPVEVGIGIGNNWLEAH